jgi:hypothetical protein
MDPHVLGAFARHDNLLTRAEAVAAGCSPTQVDEWVRRGAWTVVRRGVYALPSFWETLDDAGRRLQESRAVSLAMRRHHVRSHESAALELGMQILHPSPWLVHVTRPGIRGSRTEHGVKHHKAPFRPEQVITTGRWTYLDPARTAADIAREHGLTHGVVAFDAAYRLGATKADLDRAIEPMRHWRAAGVVRSAAGLAHPWAETIAESLGRLLVVELGFGTPEPQLGLRAGGREAWCDLRLGRHVFEVDGRVTYDPVGHGGYGGYASDPREALWAEKQRQDFVTGFKLGVSRIVWADFWGRRRDLARERLTREYLDTVRRFGTDISDLERYRIAGPPPFVRRRTASG